MVRLSYSVLFLQALALFFTGRTSITVSLRYGTVPFFSYEKALVEQMVAAFTSLPHARMKRDRSGNIHA